MSEQERVFGWKQAKVKRIGTILLVGLWRTDGYLYGHPMQVKTDEEAALLERKLRLLFTRMTKFLDDTQPTPADFHGSIGGRAETVEEFAAIFETFAESAKFEQGRI